MRGRRTPRGDFGAWRGPWDSEDLQTQEWGIPLQGPQPGVILANPAEFREASPLGMSRSVLSPTNEHHPIDRLAGGQGSLRPGPGDGDRGGGVGPGRGLDEREPL